MLKLFWLSQILLVFISFVFDTKKLMTLVLLDYPGKGYT